MLVPVVSFVSGYVAGIVSKCVWDGIGNSQKEQAKPVPIEKELQSAPIKEEELRAKIEVVDSKLEELSALMACDKTPKKGEGESRTERFNRRKEQQKAA